MESGRDLFLDPALARANYQRRFEAHATEVRAICERLGCTVQRVVTDKPLEFALFDFLKARAARSKLTIRRANRSGVHP